jgi:hypothetical protein
MTTGRINQITHLEGTRHPPGGGRPGPQPPKGQKFVKRKGRTERPAAAATPAYRGAVDDHPIAPTKPLSAGPHAGIQPGHPLGRGLAAAYGPRVEGPDPVDNAGERRIPRGGSPQESWCQVWPAAIRPQTPAVPGTKWPPGFGRRGDAKRMTRYDPGQPRAAGVTGAPPERDAPNTPSAGGGRGGTGRRSAKPQQTITSGAGAGPKASHTPEPERRSVLQGRL